jgi:hypothetical protein
MRILSHRGLWRRPEERNTKTAFAESFEAGFGTETDLRDICGEIVISHDMPKGNEMPFEELLKLMDGRNLPLALNIKADGMALKIKEALQKFNHTNYFTFDMSIPELVFQIKQGLCVYTGMSDIMPEPVLADKAGGIWLDCFYSDWYGTDTLDSLVSRYKAVCVVSADLHKRDTEKQWAVIKRAECFLTDNITLCTDKPFEAKRFFHDEGGCN